METKILTPSLTIGKKTDSKELIVRREYEIVDFDEQRRWFLKFTILFGGTLLFLPRTSYGIWPAVAAIAAVVIAISNVYGLYRWDKEGRGNGSLEAKTSGGETYILIFPVATGEISESLPDPTVEDVEGDEAKMILNIIIDNYSHSIEVKKVN